MALQDPITRFEQLRSDLVALPEVSPRALSLQAIEGVIADTRRKGGNVIQTLAAHVASHSSLTVDQATSVLVNAGADAVDANPAAVSKAVSAAATILSAGTITTDPVAFNEWCRLACAAAFAAVIGGY